MQNQFIHRYDARNIDDDERRRSVVKDVAS